MNRLFPGLGIACAALLLAAAPATAQVTSLGPSPYLSGADSPFNATAFSWFVRLTAEPGAQSAPGFNLNGLQIVGPGGITDSVDGDDGFIDGNGSNGRSYFTCPSFVDIRFDAAVLGSLPSHAGLVWTDGANGVVVRGYGPADELLGTITGNSSDGNFNSGTGEDRFYAFISPGGISRITMSDQNNCIEVDHIQAGRAGTAPCGPADIGSTGGVPGPDGSLDNNDFVVFIEWFFTGNAGADRGAQGGVPGSDGVWDNNDFIVFIDQFFAAC
ncbi:MAG: GC-type dockerin domain-anchored protein [Phycisphaerales bacterium]|nr:GC-type dockerin domain-anchored protein [Phycisphaerales bacterium]